jgi:hypothetical protein
MPKSLFGSFANQRSLSVLNNVTNYLITSCARLSPRIISTVGIGSCAGALIVTGCGAREERGFAEAT